MLGERCETGAPLWRHFPKLFQSFKVVYRDPTTTESSTLLAICIIEGSNLIFQLNFQNPGIIISFVTLLSPNWVKRAQSCISCLKGDRKTEINIWWKSHWDLLFKKLQVWLLEFFSEISFSKNGRFDSCGEVINPKLGQKVSRPVFHVPIMIERWESMVTGNLR